MSQKWIRTFLVLLITGSLISALSGCSDRGDLNNTETTSLPPNTEETESKEPDVAPTENNIEKEETQSKEPVSEPEKKVEEEATPVPPGYKSVDVQVHNSPEGEPLRLKMNIPSNWVIDGGVIDDENGKKVGGGMWMEKILEEGETLDMLDNPEGVPNFYESSIVEVNGREFLLNRGGLEYTDLYSYDFIFEKYVININFYVPQSEKNVMSFDPILSSIVAYHDEAVSEPEKKVEEEATPVPPGYKSVDVQVHNSPEGEPLRLKMNIPSNWVIDGGVIDDENGKKVGGGMWMCQILEEGETLDMLENPEKMPTFYEGSMVEIDGREFLLNRGGLEYTDLYSYDFIFEKYVININFYVPHSEKNVMSFDPILSSIVAYHDR